MVAICGGRDFESPTYQTDDILSWLVLFIPGLILGLVFLICQSDSSFFNFKVFSIAEQAIFSDTHFFSISENNFLDEISSILIIIGALLIAFSKEKSEDKFLSKIWLESLVWATYINYAILIPAIIFVYDMTFLCVLAFDMFTLRKIQFAYYSSFKKRS